MLIDIHAQRNRGTLSDESLPLLNIQTHHILYLLRKKFNKQYKLNRGGRENLLAWGELIKKHGFSKLWIFLVFQRRTSLYGVVCLWIKAKNILETNQDVWYLDLTHRVSKDFGKRMKNSSVYLYTVVARDKVTGMGVPCAFHYKYIERRSNHSVFGIS